MKAALITGAGQLEVREFPEPTPAPGGVVVDIAYCGVCATDVGAYVSGRPYPPAVCGHEWTGTVTAVGAEVSSVGEGDRVVVGVPAACATCGACRTGHAAHCTTVQAVARGRDPDAPPHGGFAPRLSVAEHRVVPAHPDLDDATLAQVEPVTVAVHAVHRSAMAPGAVAVVLGAGSLGLTTAQCASALGAGRVVVVEPSAERRAVAVDLGVHLAVTPEAAADAVAEQTGGVGADVVFECSGAPAALGAAADLLRPGGTLCLVGLAAGEVAVDTGAWLRRELTVTAALAYQRAEFAEAMDLLATGAVDVAPLHTATVGLGDLDTAMADMASGSTADLKVLVDPRADDGDLA